MRPAAALLLMERDAIRPILATASPEEFDLPTVCDGWSVRDVLAHCAAALTQTAASALHTFSPADNQRDVDERRPWLVADVLDELYAGYEAAAGVIDAANGRLDGIGLGEWVHGGDVREPLGAPDAYVSPGVDLALELLLDRSRTNGAVGLDVVIDGRRFTFGDGPADGHLTTDLETFVRLAGGRRPSPDRYVLEGAQPTDLVLFA